MKQGNVGGSCSTHRDCEEWVQNFAR